MIKIISLSAIALSGVTMSNSTESFENNKYEINGNLYAHNDVINYIETNTGKEVYDSTLEVNDNIPSFEFVDGTTLETINLSTVYDLDSDKYSSLLELDSLDLSIEDEHIIDNLIYSYNNGTVLSERHYNEFDRILSENTMEANAWWWRYTDEEKDHEKYWDYGDYYLMESYQIKMEKDASKWENNGSAVCSRWTKRDWRFGYRYTKGDSCGRRKHYYQPQKKVYYKDEKWVDRERSLGNPTDAIKVTDTNSYFDWRLFKYTVHNSAEVEIRPIEYYAEYSDELSTIFMASRNVDENQCVIDEVYLRNAELLANGESSKSDTIGIYGIGNVEAQFRHYHPEAGYSAISKKSFYIKPKLSKLGVETESFSELRASLELFLNDDKNDVEDILMHYAVQKAFDDFNDEILEADVFSLLDTAYDAWSLYTLSGNVTKVLSKEMAKSKFLVEFTSGFLEGIVEDELVSRHELESYNSMFTEVFGDGGEWYDYIEIQIHPDVKKVLIQEGFKEKFEQKYTETLGVIAFLLSPANQDIGTNHIVYGL